MIRLTALFCLIATLFWLSGCGETFRGVKDDAQRMGRGMKTIFVAD